MKKKRLILAFLFVLSLIGISFYGGAVTYIFFWTVLALPIILYFYIFMVIANLKIYQKPDGRNMISGRPSEFYITLQNETFFSFSSLSIKFYSSFSTISDILEDVEYELPPHSKIQKKTKLLCRYRGEYEVGVKMITVRDFLGVFSVTCRIKEPLNVIVSPARLRLFERYLPGEMADANSENRAYKSIPDIPVREYLPGDDMRHINWKASAVMNRLMIREMTGEERNGVALIMDPGRYADGTEEYLPPENKETECVLGLALYYLEHNIPVDVYTGDREGRLSLTDAGDYELLYAALTGYTFAGGKTIVETAGAIADPGRYRMFIFVAQKNVRELLTMAENMGMGDVPVLIYLIDDKDGEAAWAADISVVPIGAKTEIGEGLP
ncbi:MAG: DUF58 domain-containing protein [Lachnospiraceae bacterium]|nr:DUF58 domain-containing protein [Lachnospiraceae bacterium]